MKRILFFALSWAMLSTAAMAQQHAHSPAAEADKAQVAQAEFKVWGNCMMCKKRIEGALADMEGVVEAHWDVDSKMMHVRYDEQVVSLMQIKKAIAGVGHDTDEVRAPDEVYNQLPGCCQYERPEQ